MVLLCPGECILGASTECAAFAHKNPGRQPLLIHIRIRNLGDKPVRVLPFQRSLWSRLFLTFKEPVAGNPWGNRFVIGTLPRLTGIRPVLPVQLRAGASCAATIDLLTWQSYVYRSSSALDQTPLFSFPGAYRFHVTYSVDQEAAKAFNIPQTSAVSETLAVEVSPGPSTEAPDSEKKVKSALAQANFVPHWTDIDGITRPVPPSKEQITREARERIKTIYDSVRNMDAAKYKNAPLFDYMLGFTFHLADSGRLTFYPMVFRQTQKTLLSRPDRIAALRTRMKELESSLRTNGIDAHASGRWEHFFSRCGNE